jgi:hypothetical protein
MKKLAIAMLFSILLTACGSTTKPAAHVSMTGAQFNLQVQYSGDPNTPLVAVLVTLEPTACPSGVPAIGWNAGPPACLSASDFLPATSTPQSLLIAVPSNPLPPGSGYGFYFSYISGTENIVGNGVFWPSGNATGTWQCTPEMPCSGMTGTFAAQ